MKSQVQHNPFKREIQALVNGLSVSGITADYTGLKSLANAARDVVQELIDSFRKDGVDGFIQALSAMIKGGKEHLRKLFSFPPNLRGSLPPISIGR